MVTKPVLVFGAKGQVGQELMALCATRGVEALGLSRTDVDIRDADQVEAMVARAPPRLIVNAAAYTAVDKAENDAGLAKSVNCDAAGFIAESAARHDVPLVHLSTDYVFDGTKVGAYTEDDPIAPLGVYGRTKADGEIAVRGSHAQHVIMRTAWVYGPYGNNFLKTMMRLAAERDSLRVVADQRGCPTATIDIAAAILAIDALFASGRSIGGTLHFAGSGATSWHGFAEAIVAAQTRATGKRPPVTPIATAEYPTPAKRPANSELDSDRFATLVGYRALDWRDRVIEVVTQLTARETAQ